MTYVSVSTEVDVEVNLSDIDVEDLCEELESRGFKVYGKEESNTNNITTQSGEQLGCDIEELYYAYTMKMPTFDKLLIDFFDKSIGRIA